jgi:hypothetical protein
MSQSPYATSLFREAVQGLIGGSITWLLTCALAGALATAVTAERVDDVSWFWLLAWVGHLAAAGIGLWGLIVICIHVWCVSSLVHGTERVLRVIVVAFFVQLTTSAIVIVTFEHEHFHRMMMLWLPFATISIILFIGSSLRQAHDSGA